GALPVGEDLAGLVHDADLDGVLVVVEADEDGYLGHGLWLRSEGWGTTLLQGKPRDRVAGGATGFHPHLQRTGPGPLMTFDCQNRRIRAYTPGPAWNVSDAWVGRPPVVAPSGFDSQYPLGKGSVPRPVGYC